MMTNEEAIRILDPKTTREALVEIEYYAGFNGQRAVMEAVNEACIMGAEALKRQEAVLKWLRKEASLYVTAEDDYHKGIRAGIRYAIDVLTNYHFDDNDKVKAGEHHD